MRIDWKGVLNRAPEALEKLVSLGLSIDSYNNQKNMRQSIWSGYGRYNYGMGAYGSGMYGSGMDGSGIWATVEKTIADMEQFTQSVINGSDGCVGGGGTSGSVGSSGSQQTTITPEDEKLGVSLKNGKDTKFMNIDDWDTLNQKNNCTETEQNSWKSMYTTGLKKLASAFAKQLDTNNDGKITKDEFTRYFKSQIIKSEGDENIDKLAINAWNKINFNLDNNSSLDEEEMMALLATLDSSGDEGVNGEIKAEDIINGLLKIATSDDVDLKTSYNSILNGSESEPQNPNEEQDDGGNPGA